MEVGLRRFGHLGAVGVEQQRQVGVDRRLPAEPLVEEQVLGGGVDPLLAADDVADPHEVVVDDDRQVVGGEAVRLEQDLVVEAGEVEADLTPQQVGHGAGALAGDLHADDAGLARRPAPAAVPGVGAALGLVGGRLSGLLARGPPGGQLPGGREGVVGVSGLDEGLRGLPVAVEALALPVGARGAAHVGALVPVEPQPAQGVDQAALVVRVGPRPVGVLDAQDHPAAAAAGEEAVEEGDVGRPQVRGAGGGRGDTDADVGHGGSRNRCGWRLRRGRSKIPPARAGATPRKPDPVPAEVA